LVVVFYSGHGFSDQGLVWHPKTGDYVNNLRFDYVENYLLGPIRQFSDILVLLDCCCAMSFMKGGQGRIQEVIGASGTSARTPVRSFTPALCQILQETPVEVGIKAIDVHRLLLHKLRTSPIHTFISGSESILLTPVMNRDTVSRPHKEAVVMIHLNDSRKLDSTVILAIVPLFMASMLSRVLDVEMLYIAD
jgi:hypothetical protein